MQLLVYSIPTMTPSSCIDRRSCYPNVFGMSRFIAWHCAFALEDGRNICRNPHVPLRIIGGIRLWQECAKGSWESGHVSSLRHVVSLCAILHPYFPPRFGVKERFPMYICSHHCWRFCCEVWDGLGFELSTEHVVDIS